MTITQARLKELFEYRGDGLYWKVSERNIKPGMRAGCIEKANNYRRIRIDGGLYREHRLVWLYFYGELPRMLDHIDGDGTNNRISNLRIANHVTNGYNRKANKNNTTGYKNISRRKDGKYQVSFFIEGRTRHCRSFESLDDAVLYSIETRKKVHGEYARHD